MSADQVIFLLLLFDLRLGRLKT